MLMHRGQGACLETFSVRPVGPNALGLLSMERMMSNFWMYVSYSTEEIAVATQKTVVALAKGIVREEKSGIYVFEDPGLSLSLLHNVPGVWGKMFGPNGWYGENEWAHYPRDAMPQKRRLRFPSAAFGKSFSDQKKLLLPGETIASVREVATFFVFQRMLMRIPFSFPDWFYHCVEETKGQNHVTISCGWETVTIDASYRSHPGHPRLGMAVSCPLPPEV